MSENEQQTEEYLTLLDVYKGDRRIDLNKINTNSYRIGVNYSSKCCVIVFYTLPEDYPEASIPQFTIKTKQMWLSEGQMNIALNKLNDIALEYIGTGCIYMIIDYLLNNAVDDMKAKVFKDEVEPIDEDDVEDDNSATIEAEQPQNQKQTDEDEFDVNEIQGIKIYQGVPVQDRKSKFIAFGAHVESEEQAQMVFDELLRNKKISVAYHNMKVYRIINPYGNISCDYDEDGEHGSGKELLRTLERIDAKNVCVMVSRWYGGIHLGPVRYKHICTCALNVMYDNNLVPKPDGKKK